MVGGKTGEIDREQEHLTRLYTRLDHLRDQTRERLAEIRRRGASGTPQNRSERDAFATMYEDRLAQLNAVESGLCFGRLDDDDFGPIRPSAPPAGGDALIEWARVANLQSLERLGADAADPPDPDRATPRSASAFSYDVVFHGSGGEVIPTASPPPP